MPPGKHVLRPSEDHALKLSPDRLEFVDSLQPETLTVSLENISQRTTCYKVRLKAGDANKFRVNPVTGSINSNEKINITVKYKPDGTRAIDTKLQIKYLELEAGQSYRKTMFEEEKDAVRTLLLPFTFTDLDLEADDMFRTPKASEESPAATGKWWRQKEK